MGSCIRYVQVDDLLSLIAELEDKLERLRSIRKSERDMDCWDHALASLSQEKPTERSSSIHPPAKSRYQL